MLKIKNCKNIMTTEARHKMTVWTQSQKKFQMFSESAENQGTRPITLFVKKQWYDFYFFEQLSQI